MEYRDITAYIDNRAQKGLVKISVDFEDVDNDGSNLFVIKTKETYHFEEEKDADAFIDIMRQENGFVGITKKFKAGKINKAGEMVRPDLFIVTVTLNH